VRSKAKTAKHLRPRALSLGSALTVREVAGQAQALRQLLLPEALAPQAVRLDARALESIDTAGVQLLVAAAAAAQRRGYKLQLLGGQRLLDGAAAALGLRAPLLELLQVLP
jgi:ABC-type transporter Mla MlaB component